MARLLEELEPLEKLALVNMSYSRLETLSKCEAQYFFSYILKEEREFGPAAKLGNIVHTVLENIDLNDMNLSGMMSAYKEELVKEDPDDLIDAVLREAGRQCLIDFFDRYDGDLFDVLGKEKEFHIIIKNFYFTGYIDRVDKLPGKGIEVVDYKTGKWQVSKKDFPNNLQLGLYALACSLLYPDQWPIKTSLHYLRSGDIMSREYWPEDVVNVERVIEDKLEDIVTKRNYAYTKNSWTCKKLCDYGKNGVCRRGMTICGTWDKSKYPS